MSRTYRKIKHACINARRISFRSQRRNTYYWVQELEEEGYYPRSRDKKLACKGYLDNWDDYFVSGYAEMDWIEHDYEKEKVVEELWYKGWVEYFIYGWRDSRGRTKVYEKMQDKRLKKMKTIDQRNSDD